MKAFKKILTAAVFTLFIGISAFANKPEVVNTNEDLRTTITESVKGFDLSSSNEKNLKATLVFSLRKDGEIILLDTGTKNYRLHNFLKERINHMMVNIGDLNPGTYTINLEFKLI